MNQLIESAMEAIKRGDKNKAFDLLKQVLTADPNDLDAWLVLEKITDQPERKRQILDRILRIDPVNQAAREKLTNLDRLAMGSHPTETKQNPSVATPTTLPPDISNEPLQKPEVQPRRQPVSSTAQPQPFSSHQQAPSLKLDKPIVFRYPFRGRVGYFIIAAIFGCIGLIIIAQGDATSLPLLCMGTLFGLAALSNQSSIRVSETGILLSNLLSKAEIRWNEIESIKSNVVGKKLELIPNKGNALKISNQIEGYPALVEIIRQKRPDLFKTNSNQSAGKNTPANKFDASPSMNVDRASQPRYTGVKTFSKNFIGQYGVLLLMLPFCIIGPLFIYLRSDWFVGISFGLIGLFFMVSSLFNVNQVTLDSNKLKTESFFQQKDYTANQIKEISMKTVRSRRGIATNFVNIQPVEGNAISMAGFPEGDEIIYATLMEWWNTYKNE